MAADEQYTIDPVTKYEFKVWYKPDPHYAGEYNKDCGSGLHGIFDSMARALEEKKKCEDWFMIERSNSNMKDGFVQKEGAQGEIKTTVHKNVQVWIEEWVNGVKKERKVVTAA